MPTVLITGANRGIGLGLVKEYQNSFWSVLACCRRPELATDLLKATENKRGKLKLFKLDVNSEEDIQQLLAQIQYQPIDILINNAGIWGPPHLRFGQAEASSWLEVFRTNSIAPLLLVQALIENIKNSQCKTIVNMSSGMGSIEDNPDGKSYVYRSSKAALNMVTKCLSIDLKDQGIIAVALDPGWVRTDMGGPNAELSVEESVRGIKETIDGLSLKDSGRFINYESLSLSW